MLWLQTSIETIQRLADEGTPQSLTYAALESRLAIERVCYERLRVAHDYIPHDEIKKKWQPQNVMNKLIQEVDTHIASPLTLSISKTPTEPKDGDNKRGDYEKHEYVEVGRQIGFDAKKLGKLWNALGSFLHVRLPKTKGDSIAIYGNENAIRTKLVEVLIELRRLEGGTLIMSGMGRTVQFECACGSVNKRRADMLKDGQILSCINPKCNEKWDVSFEGKDIFFNWRSTPVKCHSCSHITKIPEMTLLDLERDQLIKFVCANCGSNNFLRWKLMQEKQVQS